MKITHLMDVGYMVGYRCYCGKKLEFFPSPRNWTVDARRTNCKGAMRVIKASWNIFLNHEARRKK